MADIIAHRGASGYLPEHTLQSKALAHSMGAEFIEQDVVASRDDELVVLHDIHLDRVTDVAHRYPDRVRADGRWYVRDFDLAELRLLKVSERFNADGSAVYPERYPVRTGDFRLHTLREEIGFIRHLNASGEHQAGYYPEIKKPAWHHREGVDVLGLMLGLLEEEGLYGRPEQVVLQCFDAVELKRLRADFDCPCPRVQLIGDNSWGEAATNYATMLTAEGLQAVAEYADGIGPWLPQAYVVDSASGQPRSSGLVAAAQSAGLIVHPYTFRADDLPAGFERFDDLVTFFVEGEGVDGLFTDFPDLARRPAV